MGCLLVIIGTVIGGALFGWVGALAPTAMWGVWELLLMLDRVDGAAKATIEMNERQKNASR